MSTELCGSVPPLQLAHPLANEARAISEPNAPRIEGCKERDRLAVYECYFSQIKRHRIRLFCKEVVDHVYVHFFMTCKGVQLIDRDRLVQLFISGHFQEMHINMIDDLLTEETDPVVLDLGEVTLVDREAIKFLATLDARGVGLRNCPGFIREWMRKL